MPIAKYELNKFITIWKPSVMGWLLSKVLWGPCCLLVPFLFSTSINDVLVYKMLVCLLHDTIQSMAYLAVV